VAWTVFGMDPPLEYGEVGFELTRSLGVLVRLARDGVAGCDGASFSVVHGDSLSTLAASEYRVRSIDIAQYDHGDGPCVAAIHERRVVVVDDYRDDPRWPTVAAAAVAERVRSSLSVPLLDDHGQALGGLNLYGDAPAGFGEDSRESAASFARQATLLLAQMRVLQDERAGRAREHQVAATLQRSLLPTLPVLPGWSSAARYLVSQQDAQVGGDWYDLFEIPDGAVGVAVGDVMGHDVAAAAAMGQLRSVLRSYAYEGTSPSVVLDRLDRLVQGFEMAQVATVLFGRLSRDDGAASLVLANAGHLPPLLWHADGRVETIEHGRSALIGVLPPGHRPHVEATLPVPAGSTLILYTDGLVETRTREFDHGIDQLRATLSALDPHSALDVVCEAIVSALVVGHREDDVALLAVRNDG
jgi:serine phosphatase RsbU (regulator of sigma subunit)